MLVYSVIVMDRVSVAGGTNLVPTMTQMMGHDRGEDVPCAACSRSMLNFVYLPAALYLLYLHSDVQPTASCIPCHNARPAVVVP